MKALFLDIDGVVNCRTTVGRQHGRLVIEPRLAGLVRRIADAIPDLKIILSSSWRETRSTRRIIDRRVIPCFDVTPVIDAEDDVRGLEIQAWLDTNPTVTHYAIVDDADDMLAHQLPNFFRTDTDVGLTADLTHRIIRHLGG